MNILLVHHLIRVSESQVTFTAVDYYRMQKPMQVLNRLDPEINYATIDSLKVEDSFLQRFDLVLFSRTMPREAPERLNKLGIPFGLDLDDYWNLPDDHILAPSYKTNKTPELIIDSIKAAHFVTCTTEILASYIKEFNENVYVVENGIDTDDDIWQPNKSKSDRVRFGFTQGSTHIPDVALVSKDVAKSLYDNKFYHKGQVVLCGFSARHQEESVYIGYERMLTDDLKPLKFYPKYCHELKILHNPLGLDMPYRRIWTRDVDEFGSVYDDIDIAVAPLKESTFNSCKSNIKMLEAGFKDCAVMVSDISPYTPLATKENSFLLNEKSFFEWQRYILLNPSIIEDKKAQLKEDVKWFELKNLTKKRKEVYESCIGVLK